MGTVDEDTLNQQRQRRKRINRIKKAIIFTIVFWMLASLTAIIVLSVCLVRVNSRLHKITSQNKVVYVEPTETSENSESIQNDKNESIVANGIDTTDNLAIEGDIHQVYLTFDGCPSENTIQILDILAEYNVKATFFVVGKQSEDMQDVYKKIVEQGHTLGMRSYSNTFSKIYGSTEAFSQDYDLIHSYMQELTGVDCKYYRFPGGSRNTITNVDMTEFAQVLKEKGVTYFDWNVSAGDASNDYTSDDVVNNVMDGVNKYKTSVVLLHDGEGKEATVEALPRLIESLQSSQAEILPIDENTKVIQYLKMESIE